MIKTVFIDFDNTLHDSDSKYIAKLDGLLGLSGEELWRIYFHEVHHGVVHAKFKNRHDDVEFHCKLIFRYLKRPYDRDLADEIRARYMEAMRECWESPTYFPDSLPFLNHVKEMGIKTCLTTGEFAPEKAKGLEVFASRKYFDYVFGEAEVGFLKTEPDYYGNALRLSNSLPAETLCIGDSMVSDIVPAKSVGITTLWLNRKKESTLGTRQRPDYEAENLTEAMRYLYPF